MTDLNKFKHCAACGFAGVSQYPINERLRDKTLRVNLKCYNARFLEGYVEGDPSRSSGVELSMLLLAKCKLIVGKTNNYVR